MEAVDLRSDTVTQPTAAMREAMARADVGDDVFGEDPTIKRLEAAAAERMGKAAALFVASGTMANLVALLTHCGRGDEVILGDQSHIFHYEQGGCAALGGIHPRILPNRPDGTLEPGAIAAAVRPDDPHFPRSRLVALENTHNRCNGAPLTGDYVAEVAEVARRNGLRLHVDGARIFNAAAALGCPPRDLAAPADSVGFCLSKGLGAPVGSVLCGDAGFIDRARRNRKLVGGGMRQAGFLAAAGLVALERMVDRLQEDHRHAARLAEGWGELADLEVLPAARRTNIVFADILRDGLSAAAACDALAGLGIRVLPVGHRRIRAVTHYHITAADVDRAVAAMETVLAGSHTVSA